MNKFSKKEINLCEYYNALNQHRYSLQEKQRVLISPLLTLIDAYQGDDEKLSILQDVCDEYIECTKYYYNGDTSLTIKDISIPESIQKTILIAAKFEEEQTSTLRAQRINQNITKLLPKESSIPEIKESTKIF